MSQQHRLSSGGRRGSNGSGAILNGQGLSGEDIDSSESEPLLLEEEQQPFLSGHGDSATSKQSAGEVANNSFEYRWLTAADQAAFSAVTQASPTSSANRLGDLQHRQHFPVIPGSSSFTSTSSEEQRMTLEQSICEGR